MQKPNVLLLGANEILEAALRGALKDSCKVLPVAVAADSIADEYARRQAGAVIVFLDAGVMSDRFTAMGQVAAAGGTVIVVSPSKDPDLILRAMRAGAREFLLEGDQEGLRQAIRSHAQSARAGDAADTSSVVTVFGAKGGVGSTTIAANLAGALQAAGQRVCLVDLNMHLGDVLSFMDVPGTYSISDVVANMARLDDELLSSSMIHHSSGVDVLAQSGKMEDAEQIDAGDVSALLAFLRRHYDKVVIDGIRGFDEISLAALDASQHVLMVLTQDVPAVRNGVRCLETFRRLHYDEAKVRVVLNRYQKASKITLGVIGETLRLPVAHALGNDFASVIDAINRGLLLKDAAPRARLTQDIQDLVPLVSAGDKQPVARRSFLGGLFGSKKVANGAS
ncbi:MAG TPA: AAA family ATPase [Polyangia bacterium]|jgi:pilus assembly protein CpaE|nr:AAA family ATPase [Polyangia bacterium]